MSPRVRYIFFVILVHFFGSCYAYTSIATVDGYALTSWWRSSNYVSQNDADAAALEGCRSEARRNGIGNLAKKCKIVTRATEPGYGALVCGDDGCSWTTGYESGQAAIDAAYEGCSKKYKNCQEKDIAFWEDFSGFSSNKAKKISSPDCRPRTATINCRAHCENGNCIVTYENGCKIRVQVTPKFDGFNNQWIYPSPSC